MGTLFQDVKFGLRMLGKNPGFTAVAVMTLALGIGANTAIFSLVNASLLRPLPYPEPDNLVLLWGNTVRAGVVERRGASYPDFQDWREQSASYTGMAAFTDGGMILRDDGDPERVLGELVAAPYLAVLGVRPHLGRSLQTEEDQPNAFPVVMISHDLWVRRYGSDPDVIGRRLQMGNGTYELIAVLPPGFRGLTDRADFWVPLAPNIGQGVNARGSRFLQVVARLQPGTSPEQAQSEISTVAHRLQAEYPGTNDQRGVELIGLQQEVFSGMRRPLLMMLAAVLAVLLIACANVGSLLLARAEQRQREIAVRRALGASSARVVRQLLTEGALLSLLGAALGLLLAGWLQDALISLSPIPLPSYVQASLDTRILLFTAAVAVLTALLIGLAPALHFGMEGLQQTLKEASGRSAGTNRRRVLRNALVTAEVALALVLLVGAGLLIQTFRSLIAIDPGFDPEGVLTLRMNLSPEEANAATMVTRALQVADRVGSVPSVTGVALSSDTPLDDTSRAAFYTPEGNTVTAEQKRPRAYVHRVSPEFFHVLRIPLLRGRTFTRHEMHSETRLALVSEDVGRRYWSGDNPTGKRFKFGPPDSDEPWYQVIGVVGDVKYRGLPRNPTPDPDIYLPLSESAGTVTLTARTGGNAAAISRAVQSAIKEVDGSIATFSGATMEERIGTQLATANFARSVMSIFAGLALLLMLVGIYAVMSFLVSERTREIGIRMALGARPANIITNFLRRALLLVSLGVVAGVVLSLAVGRAMGELLFGVSAGSPVVLGVVIVLTLATALLATYIPARRASRVDPLVALRAE